LNEINKLISNHKGKLGARAGLRSCSSVLDAIDSLKVMHVTFSIEVEKAIEDGKNNEVEALQAELEALRIDNKELEDEKLAREAEARARKDEEMREVVARMERLVMGRSPDHRK